MLILKGNQRGKTLNFPLSYTLVLPDAALDGASYPLIYCLHDLGGSAEALLRGGQVAHMADELGAALVLPNGRRSCFLDMAHGPRWNTELGVSLAESLRLSLRVRGGTMGAVGVGAGALGAMQLARRYGFACAAVNPALDMPFARDEALWPMEAEWLGVFEGKQGEWAKDCFTDTRGCVLGGENTLQSGISRMGLEAWAQDTAPASMEDKLTRALRMCREML